MAQTSAGRRRDTRRHPLYRRPARGNRRQRSHRRAEQDVELVGESEDEPGVDSGTCCRHNSRGGQGHPAEPLPEPGMKPGVQRPPDDACHHQGKDNVDVKVADLVLPVQRVFRPQVEDTVGAQRGGGAVEEVEEPHRAVDQGEPNGQQGVDSADRQAVEGELQRLVGRLPDLPGDVAYDHDRQDCCYKAALAFKPHTHGATRWAPLLALCSRGSRRSSRPPAGSPLPRWTVPQPRRHRRSCSRPRCCRSR